MALKMLNYLYLDYGGQAEYRAELKYSLISLKAELDPAKARIVVASDAPEIYRAWPVTVMDIAPAHPGLVGRRALLSPHQARPGARGAESGSPSRCCSWIPIPSSVPAFMPRWKTKMADAVVMNRFEKPNPIPPLKGFRTQLPHLGAYRYDVAHSWMYNSGLIGMRPAASAAAGRYAGDDRCPDRPRQEISRHRAIRLVGSAALEPDARSRKSTTASCITGRGGGASIWPTRSPRRCRRIGTI